MKKKLILICTTLLVIGCFKAEPKQDENIKVVKTSGVVKDVEVAREKVEEDSKSIEEVIPPKKNPITKTHRKTKPMIIPGPSKEEIELALKKDVKDKVKIDKKITREPEKVTRSNELPIEETHEKKSPLIYIILGTVAAAGAGIFFFKGKGTPPNNDDVG